MGRGEKFESDPHLFFQGRERSGRKNRGLPPICPGKKNRALPPIALNVLVQDLTLLVLVHLTLLAHLFMCMWRMRRYSLGFICKKISAILSG